ncbi:uncharacterized protein BDCG_03025 [Blastomyces dermatitidis ER-3]|uniref:VOC domain-containing protein n=1 Tax=Ajellomyces dermatitidis (strain ER-3 / ATCC MYA-2586) TaxID=559297 RepID=A0ABP2EVD0_AJEDR|nr:uncharacterized protein BDCG_03025 [Blastomyces dermatitidis ER-3]EEQ87905.2 hypothetical protein BDCG_03025 [Blastomyces dermatitidis ER-3]
MGGYLKRVDGMGNIQVQGKRSSIITESKNRNISIPIYLSRINPLFHQAFCPPIYLPKAQPTHSPTMAPPKMSFAISLATTDIEATKRFGTALGFTVQACYDADTTLRLKYDDSFGIFYATHSVISKFLPAGREIASTKVAHEVIVTLSVNSKEQVDTMIQNGLAAGGKEGPNMVPEECAGAALYSRSIEDPDGHLYEILFYDSQAAALEGPCSFKKEEK